jgi:hypothetical protein
MAKQKISLVELLKDIPWFGVEEHPPRFPKELSKPILVPDGMPKADSVERITIAVFNERVRKLDLLQKLFGTDKTDDPWFYLSLRLACAFVPGMQVARRGRGRPAKWKGLLAFEVVAAVEQKVADGLSVPRAITELKTKWKTLNESRYYEMVREIKSHGIDIRRKYGK